MLKIVTDDIEFYNEDTNHFFTVKGAELLLEHNLIAISKWEAKHHKSWFKNQLTSDEFIDYIRCMTINIDEIDQNVFKCIGDENINRIKEYLDDPMTGTTIKNNGSNHSSGSFITSETIYADMAQLMIPFTCETWHINRLLTLITVCAERNKEPEKMSHNQILAQNKALNKARRAKLHSKG